MHHHRCYPYLLGTTNGSGKENASSDEYTVCVSGVRFARHDSWRGRHDSPCPDLQLDTPQRRRCPMLPDSEYSGMVIGEAPRERKGKATGKKQKKKKKRGENAVLDL